MQSSQYGKRFSANYIYVHISQLDIIILFDFLNEINKKIHKFPKRFQMHRFLALDDQSKNHAANFQLLGTIYNSIAKLIQRHLNSGFALLMRSFHSYVICRFYDEKMMIRGAARISVRCRTFKRVGLVRGPWV